MGEGDLWGGLGIGGRNLSLVVVGIFSRDFFCRPVDNVGYRRIIESRCRNIRVKRS